MRFLSSIFARASTASASGSPSTTSGGGFSLMVEAMGLASITETPVVIVDVQRGGPSTGLPTKTEQSDLYQAVYGRNGDAPVPVRPLCDDESTISTDAWSDASTVTTPSSAR